MVLVVKGSPMTFSISLHGVEKPIKVIPFLYSNHAGIRFNLYRKTIGCNSLDLFLPYNNQTK